ncbi:MAG: SDR family oxidoreductase, partial [Demequinaceae bacterium]|nr:SDR family oxidoreductase [Demequinaceae bacterium]
MGILEGKNILVTGVLTEGSIAFDVARLCQEQGATVVLTGVGRTLKVTEAMGRRLPVEAKVVELDVTNPEQLATLADSVRQHVPHLDGVVHSIGFAPQAVLGGDFMGGTWEDV